MRLHQSTIDQVRDKAQILDLFDQSKLKKIGYEFAAQCPWHQDRRPSLSISPQKNFAFCHVCARGVDAIGWVQDQQGLTFSEAVIELAKGSGIEVKAENDEDSERFEAERQERAKLYREAESNRDRFIDLFWESEKAQSYLEGRGLSVETIVDWELGWNGQRVMFPLRDQRGKTVGFTGRVLDDSIPKYKNSQNSLIYQKAELVFGLDKALPEITRTGHVVITEGQFDVIRLWQEGIRNVIAVSGSSLTQGMIERLVRAGRVQRITLCFDGDLGGEKAAERAINELQGLALRGELDLRILTMPEGTDPADCAEAFAFLLQDESQSWVAHMFEKAVAKVDLNDPAAISTAEHNVKKLLKVLPVGGLREYVQRRAKEVLKAVPEVRPAKIQTDRQINRCRWAERRALRLYLHNEGCRPALNEIAYTDPMMKQAWEAIQTLEAMGATSQLRTCFMGLIQKIDVELANEVQSLVQPIPEVLRVVMANPVNELEGAMAVLLSDCCGGDDIDR